jgi:hypothetical protein
MQSGYQVGAAIRRALRIVAALGVLLIGTTDFSGADAQSPAGEARIDAPAEGEQVDGVVEIKGRATVSGGKQLAFYRILIGEGRSPGSQRPLGPAHEQPVENGVLGTWDTNLFLSGDHLLTLRVYATDNSFVSASRVVTVKYKPTPTPLAILLPTVVDVPTLAPLAESAAAPGPVDPPPFLDAVIDPFEPSSVRAEPAPIPSISVPGFSAPIQPIPLDANNPGPFAVDTPTTYSSGQLPGNPAPIYVTPIDFNPPQN